MRMLLSILGIPDSVWWYLPKLEMIFIMEFIVQGLLFTPLRVVLGLVRILFNVTGLLLLLLLMLLLVVGAGLRRIYSRLTSVDLTKLLQWLHLNMTKMLANERISHILMELTRLVGWLKQFLLGILMKIGV